MEQALERPPSWAHDRLIAHEESGRLVLDCCVVLELVDKIDGSAFMNNSDKRTLTPYEAIALCTAETVSEALFKQILQLAQERVKPELLGHDWNDAQAALLTYLWAKQDDAGSLNIEPLASTIPTSNGAL